MSLLILNETPIIEKYKRSLRRNKIKTIVTIGDGVAAWCLHRELGKVSDINLINISANEFFTPCSLRTTSINCLRGTEPNVSKLGDIIRESWFTFLEELNKDNLKGVDKGTEYQILEEETISKWERRYSDFSNVKDHSFLFEKIKDKNLFHAEEAYFVDPKILKEDLEKEVKITKINNLVTQIIKKNKGYEVRMHGGELYADAIFLCTNHMTPLLIKHTTDHFKKYLAHSKPVSGSYLELEKASEYGFRFDHAFNLAIEKYHFIYRKEEDRIQIGSTSENMSSRETPFEKKLIEIYEHIDNFTKFDLPEFNHFEQYLGIRYKGYKRLPFWGKVDHEEMYAVCGLYKNAFTFSFLAAKELARDFSFK